MCIVKQINKCLNLFVNNLKESHRIEFLHLVPCQQVSKKFKLFHKDWKYKKTNFFVCKNSKNNSIYKQYQSMVMNQTYTN